MQQAAHTTPLTPGSQAPVAAAPADPPANEQAALAAIDQALKDALFDYNRSTLRADAIDALRANAAVVRRALESDPDLRLLVEGHCDQRGSSEYNLALGDRRAAEAREFLLTLGLPADRLRTISYGEEHPACLEQDEPCYQRNRRAHVTYERATTAGR